MKLRYLSILVIIAVVASSLFTHDFAHSNANFPPTGRTGAPSEGTCNTSGCHTGSSVVTTSSTILFDTQNTFASGYTPGHAAYTFVLNFNPNTSTKGFEMTALDSTNTAAGTFSVGSQTNLKLQTASSRQYISHKNASSNAAWVITWTPPTNNVGPVTFYVAANAANGNGNEGGDVIHTNKFVVNAAGGANCSNYAVSITGSDVICSGSTITLSANATGNTGTNSYAWSTGSIAQTTNVTASGTYTVTATDNTCSASNTFTVNNATPGVASFSATFDILGTHIVNNSTGSVVTNIWDFGDGTTNIDSNLEFTYGYSHDGTYTITLTAVDACGDTTTASHQVTVTNVSGIESVGLNNTVSIFPNPIHDQVTVNVDGKTESYYFNIYNIQGKLVRSVQGTTGSTLQINTQNLSHGMYFYKIEMNSGANKSGKLLVE